MRLSFVIADLWNGLWSLFPKKKKKKAPGKRFKYDIS